MNKNEFPSDLVGSIPSDAEHQAELLVFYCHFYHPGISEAPSRTSGGALVFVLTIIVFVAMVQQASREFRVG